MSDNDIIKALEHCVDSGDCATCVYNSRCIDLPQDVLELINCQKAEIERLTGYNENLRAANSDITNKLWDEVEEAKTEAIKEFAEKLRNKFFNYYDGLTEHTSKSNHNGDSLMFYEVTDMIVDCIDNTMKEMTEGEDGNV